MLDTGTWKWVKHKPKFEKLSVYWDMLQYNPPWWKVRVGVCMEHHETLARSWEPSQCWWRLSCIYKVLKWQRKEEYFSDIRNRWTKTQGMKAHHVSGKGQGTRVDVTWCLELWYWPVFIVSLSLNYRLHGVNPGTVHYPLLSFQHLTQCPKPSQNSVKFFQVSKWKEELTC